MLDIPKVSVRSAQYALHLYRFKNNQRTSLPLNWAKT